MKSLTRHLPAGAFSRVRALFLGLAVVSALIAGATAATADAPAPQRLAAGLLALGLIVYWTAGYRRGSFPLAGEALEAGALYLILRYTPGSPALPLLGLMFRSLYGGPKMAAIRYLLWIGALFAAHVGRDPDLVAGDWGRALGLSLAPALMQALGAAMASSEVIQRRLSSLVQNSTDVITIVGEDMRVQWQAASIRGVLGHDPEAMVGSPLRDLVHEDDRPQLRDYFAEAEGKPGHSRSMTLRLRHGAGGHRHVEVVAANRLHDPSVGGFVLNMRDATDRHRLEHELRSLAAEREHDATHDPLTGLANRRKLFDSLESAIAEARAAKTKLALLLIDLDHFKELNDTLGHQAGDLLLREIRPRLLRAVPDAALVARVGGDEFAVLLRPGSTAEDAQAVADQLLRSIEEPFRFQGMTLLVRASIGIAVFPGHGRDVETLMQRADIAMYSAKAAGAGHEVYSASKDSHSRARLALIGELPEAIEDGQIVVYYQPKFDLQTGALSGAEALVRWQHPQFGLLGPGAFVALAEQTGLMRPLTLRVLGDALAQCAAWKAEGLELPVAVNLGAPNLLDLGLPGDVQALLDEHGVDPSLLQLEITETIVAADPVRVIEIMKRLIDLGVSLSLDDFGTGSSSFAFLRELPVQELKIDKSFVFGIEDDPGAATIARTIVELAHNLGLRAVAEGIETEAAYATVRDCGCDAGQGFLMGKPMPAAELSELARNPLPV
jgi:diguanylate cyclase (GGDEF)-like protein/PAS domain S-box-containing protein